MPIFMKKQALLFVVMATSITGCDKSDNPPVPYVPDRFISFGMVMDGEWNALLQDAVQPHAVDYASVRVLNADNWLSKTNHDNFDLISPPVLNDPITEIFDCEQGQITRTQQGNPIREETRLAFENCSIAGISYKGEVELERFQYDCVSPSLLFRYDNFHITNERRADNTGSQDHVLTGRAEYRKGSQNCASGAAGPAGAWQQLELDFDAIVSKELLRTVEYRALEVSNRRSDVFVQQDDARLEVSINGRMIMRSTDPLVTSLPEQPVLEQQINVTTVVPYLLSDNARMPNKGEFSIDAGVDGTILYQLDECDKNRVNVRQLKAQDVVRSVNVVWEESENLFASIPPPNTLLDGGPDNSPFFAESELPARPVSDLEGCL